MNWQISIASAAQKQLKKINWQDAQKIEKVIDGMVGNPFVGDIQKMVGKEDVWRRRVGSYRIFYKVNNDLLIIYILEIKRRTSNTY